MNTGWWNRQSKNFHFETYRIEDRFLASWKFNIFDLEHIPKELDRCLYFIYDPKSFLLLLQIVLLVTNHVWYLEVNQAALVEVVIGSPDILGLESDL